MSKVPTIVVIVLILAAVNGCLYIVQEADYKDAVTEAEGFEQQMNTRWAGYLAMEQRIENLESRIETNKRSIHALAADIKSIEAQHPAGIPASIYGRYTRLVREHNRLVDEARPLVAKFNAEVKSWNAQLDFYNADVDKYNELVARIPTSRWFVLPGLSSRSGARAPRPPRDPIDSIDSVEGWSS